MGCGAGFKSEKAAFTKAIEMVKETGVRIRILRMGCYYSVQKYAKSWESNSGM
ncbi:TPA: hypothetical protein HA361_06270 [Candidatus Woesearchaeota archaeon]|nr:hypothetical protein [Candidatus Woesearchaeota archaeon]